MIEFGKTLRLAREAKGYTISQLAEATRMIHQTIEDLENENFTRIAAPIYGRGFVKLYCEAVGLDPKPMVAEFMEIFSGNRELGIKERTVSVPNTENVRPSAEPETATSVPAVAIPEAIAPEPPPRPRTVIPVQTGLTSTSFGDYPAAEDPVASPAETKEKPRLSRYAAPLREASLPSIPPTVWRIAALAAGALLILWIIALGFKALYKATSGAEAGSERTETVEPAAAESVPVPTEAEKAANAGRGKVEVPPLYVD